MASILRASEVGAYLYCRRAWWYRRQGVEAENQDELAAGTELHLRHGRRIIAAALLWMLGWILLLTALTLLTIYLASRWI